MLSKIAILIKDVCYATLSSSDFFIIFTQGTPHLYAVGVGGGGMRPPKVSVKRVFAEITRLISRTLALA